MGARSRSGFGRVFVTLLLLSGCQAGNRGFAVKDDFSAGGGPDRLAPLLKARASYLGSLERRARGGSVDDER